jgi:hypothetical protein
MNRANAIEPYEEGGFRPAVARSQNPCSGTRPSLAASYPLRIDAHLAAGQVA